MPPSNLIECSITLIDAAGDDINIRFEVRNNSAVPVKILKTGTPLEGLRTDCLEVKANGILIPYDGKVAKRAAPKAADYITLQPGKTASNTVDVTEAYAIPPNAVVEIRFDEDNLSVETLQPAGKGFARSLAPVMPAIDNQGIRFESNRPAGKPTFGEKARESYKKKDLQPAGEIARARAQLKMPIIEGGTEARRQKVLIAHKRAYEMIKTAIKNLEKTHDPNFMLWFDAADSPEMRARVLEAFESMKAALERVTYIYDLSFFGCGVNDYAYVVNSGVVWICKQFWPAPPTGMASKAGTIVHEHSHLTGGTRDVTYGKKECKKLALTRPRSATRNGDSYEFYAESLDMP
jgi:peptidyl-Lys metalloendopeptidase